MHSSWPQRQVSSAAAVLHESLQYGVVPGTMHWHCGLLHCIPLMAWVIVAPLQSAMHAANAWLASCELEFPVPVDPHAIASPQFRPVLHKHPRGAVVHAHGDALRL